MDFNVITVLGAFAGMLFGIWQIARAFRTDIDKVFKRFDAHKESVDKKLFILQDIGDAKFVRQDMCQLQTLTFKEEFSRINHKLDKLLSNGAKKQS